MKSFWPQTFDQVVYDFDNGYVVILMKNWYYINNPVGRK